MAEPLILLVEDNADDIALTLRAFKKNELLNDVVVARDGQEALDYLFCEGEYLERELHTLPEMVLLDINMPRVNGLEVLDKMRKDSRTEAIPVVMLTTSDEQGDVIKSYQLGANSYIRKPMGFSQFVRAIQHVHDYWTTLNEAPA